MAVNWNQSDYPDVWLSMRSDERNKWQQAIRIEGTRSLEERMDFTRVKLLKDVRCCEISITTFKHYEILKLMKSELQSRYNKDMA